MDTRIEMASFPESARESVRRAAQVLEEQLSELKDFDIDAHWRFGTDRAGRPCALLDLTTPHNESRFGVTDYPYSLEELSGNDLTLRRRLSTQIWYFTRNLSDLIRSDLRKLRRGLAEMTPVGCE